MQVKRGLTAAALGTLLIAGVCAGIGRGASDERTHAGGAGDAGGRFVSITLTGWRSLPDLIAKFRTRLAAFPPILQLTSSPAAATPEVASPVNGSKPRWVPIQLELSGDMTGLPVGAATATVVVNVGGRAFPATASGLTYQAKINALSPEDMVVVDVTAPKVHYRSFLGTFRNVTLHSHGDRKVEQVELPALRVSPMSTAISWMVNRTLGGRDALTDQEFERATRSLASYRSDGSGEPVNDLITIAYALERIALAENAVPAGFNDNYALVQNEAAFKTYMAGTGVTEGAAGYAFSGSDYVPLHSLESVPEHLLMTSALSYAEQPYHSPAYVQLMVKGSGSRLSLFPSNPSLITSSESTPAAEYTHSTSLNQAGELEMTPDSLPTTVVSGITGFSPTEPIRVRRTVKSRVFRRLWVGDRYAVWASRTQFLDSYPDYPSQAAQFTWQTQVWSAADLDRIARPASWNGLSGLRALPWICMQRVAGSDADALRLCEYVQHRFNSDGSGVIEGAGMKVDTHMQPRMGDPGANFVWSADAAGRLTVTSANVRVKFWNIDAGDEITDVVVYLASSISGLPVGQGIAGMSMAMSGDYAWLTAEQAVGTWIPGYSITEPSRYPTSHVPISVVRFTDGKGHDFTDIDGINGPPTPSNWQVQGGRLIETRFNAFFTGAAGAGTRYVQNCAEAFAQGAQSCAPWRIRYFRPLARHGNRLYGIEEFYLQTSLKPMNYSGAYAVSLTTTRPSFYECTEGACRTPFSASAQPILIDRVDSAVAAPISLPRRTLPKKSHADLRF